MVTGLGGVHPAEQARADHRAGRERPPRHGVIGVDPLRAEEALRVAGGRPAEEEARRAGQLVREMRPFSRTDHDAGRIRSGSKVGGTAASSWRAARWSLPNSSCERRIAASTPVVRAVPAVSDPRGARRINDSSTFPCEEKGAERARSRASFSVLVRTRARPGRRAPARGRAPRPLVLRPVAGDRAAAPRRLVVAAACAPSPCREEPPAGNGGDRLSGVARGTGWDRGTDGARSWSAGRGRCRSRSRTASRHRRSIPSTRPRRRPGSRRRSCRPGCRG
jgi:hypothetical protein